ncbi:MAG: hypothetical protein M0R03_13055 [Novosphingobium sp.]|nr:hypothetical protein [Novosphingobium sp.]
MTNQDVSDYLKEKYYKDNQRLLLTLRYVDSKKYPRYDQEVECGNITLLRIQTFNCLYNYEPGYIPYCIRNYWDGYTVTVQKFGQLTNEEIHKAIGYVLHQYSKDTLFIPWNVYLDGKHIWTNNTRIYTRLQEDINRRFI